MTRRLVLMAAALLLVLAACGSGVENGSDITVDTKPDSTETTPTTDTTAPDNSDIPPGQDPRDILGDDQDLNDLANQCFDGDMGACDQLFSDTPVDSDLEAYSQTCGGRIDQQDGAPHCLARFDPADPEEPGNLSDDPELADSTPDEISQFEDQAQECFDGDLGACDDLFLDTPVGSDFETYGTTCGGRTGDDELSGNCEDLVGSGTGSSSGN